MVHLASAQLSSREGRGRDADTHLAQAAELAKATGECNDLNYHFGPANVAAWPVPGHRRPDHSHPDPQRPTRSGTGANPGPPGPAPSVGTRRPAQPLRPRRRPIFPECEALALI